MSTKTGDGGFSKRIHMEEHRHVARVALTRQWTWCAGSCEQFTVHSEKWCVVIGWRRSWNMITSHQIEPFWTARQNKNKRNSRHISSREIWPELQLVIFTAIRGNTCKTPSSKILKYTVYCIHLLLKEWWDFTVFPCFCSILEQVTQRLFFSLFLTSVNWAGVFLFQANILKKRKKIQCTEAKRHYVSKVYLSAAFQCAVNSRQGNSRGRRPSLAAVLGKNEIIKHHKHACTFFIFYFFA